MTGVGTLAVIDSSALITMKVVIPIDGQWEIFKQLETLVVDGQIAMPRQVIREITEIAHPDVPGVWASGVRGRLQHPVDADWSHLQRVMLTAGKVVDPNKTEEDADPYVLALALHLQANGHQVRVITDDHIDRLPMRIAMTSACQLLGLTSCSCRDYLAGLGVTPLRS
ncbi:MAG: DUF4411 family protein [Acidimicrobiales bacterium]